MRLSIYLLITCAALAAFIGTQSAHGQIPPQWDLCTGKADVEWDRQIKYCTALIESGKETPQGMAVAYCNRGNAWSAKGDLDRAITDYSEAIRVDPKYARAYYNLGYAWQAEGDLDRAIANYSEAIKLDPKSISYSNRGAAWSAKGDLDHAIAD